LTEVDGEAVCAVLKGDVGRKVEVEEVSPKAEQEVQKRRGEMKRWVRWQGQG
jgi:hypothetical protein